MAEYSEFRKARLQSETHGAGQDDGELAQQKYRVDGVFRHQREIRSKGYQPQKRRRVAQQLVLPQLPSEEPISPRIEEPPLGHEGVDAANRHAHAH